MRLRCFSLLPFLFIAGASAALSKSEGELQVGVAPAEAELSKASVTKDSASPRPRPGVTPGLKRLLIGAVLLVAAVAHMGVVTYPAIKPRYEEDFRKALGLTSESSWFTRVKGLGERYVKYAKETPLAAGEELVAFLLGLLLVTSGIRRARRG